MDAFAADVFAVADFCSADFVDLVEANDAPFSGGNIVIRGCQQPLDADFRIFANVTGLSEWGTVGHTKGDSKDTGKGFGHERFSYAGWA